MVGASVAFSVGMLIFSAISQPQQWSLYNKPTGFVTVPVHRNYGAAVIKRLQRITDEIFVKGIPATALV